MPSLRQLFGKQGENIAIRFLKKSGYKILVTNYRNRLGEIDIIAREKNVIVFVEVKTRHTNQFGSPKEAVTPNKQKHLSKAALTYLKETNQMQAQARFDVVAIQVSASKPSIELIKNAFELAYG